MNQHNPAVARSITIEISEDIYERLLAKAAKKKLTVEQYVKSTVMGEFATFAEIAQPISDGLKESGVTPEQAEEYLMESLRAIQIEKGEIVD